MYDIVSFGAISDGNTVNTAAIQKAVDSCAAAGGGTVNVPGGTFVTGTIWLRDNVELHLEMGARLLGSPNLDDYCADDAFAQNHASQKEQWNGAHLILGVEVNNVAVTGPGTIDGNAEEFFEPEALHGGAGYAWNQGIRHAKDKVRLRPGQMLFFCESSHVKVQNVNLVNASCWTCLFLGCDHVIADSLTITNSPTGANTDGIDIDCCECVTVSNCIITTGDDGITLRGNFARLKDKSRVCQDIAITNCVLDTSVCAFRIGVGNGIIRNASISNIVIRRAATGFLFQSAYWEPSKGVDISNIRIANIQSHSLGHPVVISAGAASATAQIEDIVIDGFQGECFAGCEFRGKAATRPRHIALRNFDLKIVDCPLKINSPDALSKTFLHFSAVDDIMLDTVRLRWAVQTTPWSGVQSIDDAQVSILPNCLLDRKNA